MKKYSKILTKEFLEREYTDNKKPLAKIANEVNCNDETIRYYLIKHNIPRRIRAEAIQLKTSLVLTKEFLHEQYITKKKSIRQISRETKFQKRTVSKHLKLNNINKRTHSESTMGYGKVEERVIDKLYYCIDCGKEIHWETGIYGSGKCQVCGQKERRKDSFSHKKYYCINCGKEVCWQTAIYGKSRCLSCAGKERFKDPRNHPCWQNGESFELYPLGWTKTFKEQIRDRDGRICQVCGCHEIECLTKLHVHHIDYIKENLNPINLISLCNSCHMKTNFNREKWILYFENKKEKITCLN